MYCAAAKAHMPVQAPTRKHHIATNAQSHDPLEASRQRWGGTQRPEDNVTFAVIPQLIAQLKHPTLGKTRNSHIDYARADVCMQRTHANSPKPCSGVSARSSARWWPGEAACIVTTTGVHLRTSSHQITACACL